MNNQINSNEPRRSRRLSTIIPASHWISIGYFPMDAQVMENLMLDMNSYCEEGIDDNVKLRPRPDHFGEHYAVPYNEMMLPLWKRFFKASCDSTDEDFKELYIKSISMDIQVVKSLSNAIMNMSYPNRLEYVKLQQCGMSDTSLLRTFLAGCSRSRIKVIDLEDNEITSQGAIAISDYISTNPVRLQAIFLNNNNISDGDVEAFVSALRLNTRLLIIELKNNDMTEQGWQFIQKVLFDATTMNSILDCNHTCLIATNDAVMRKLSLIQAEVTFINGNMNGDELGELLPTRLPIKKKIRNKVVLALCGVEGELYDLSLLDDLPLQLMPWVLELIQEHTRIRKMHYEDEDDQLEKDALSRLWHTLRGWHLPLLFDNLHGPPTRRCKRKRVASSR